jgi:hypothetical protein
MPVCDRRRKPTPATASSAWRGNNRVERPEPRARAGPGQSPVAALSEPARWNPVRVRHNPHPTLCSAMAADWVAWPVR